MPGDVATADRVRHQNRGRGGAAVAPSPGFSDPGVTDPGITAAEQALHRLRRDIVNGILLPDTKLKMRELKARYGLGATPLREALSQLAAQGFVTQASQKGFRVPALSMLHLDDVSRSRQLIEGEALRLAIENGGDAWEAEISASFYLLERRIVRLQASRQPLDADYEKIHSRFHQALIAACPLPSLIAFSSQLYTQGARYRALMLRSLPASQKIIAEHRKLRDLALARKAEKAVQALVGHIALPAKLLRDVLVGTRAQLSGAPAAQTRKPLARQFTHLAKTRTQASKRRKA